MKISVNLASRPYIDLRSIYSRLQTWILILALVGGALWYLYRNEAGQAQAARSHVALVEDHVRTLQDQQQAYRKMMQEPKDAEILEQSGFLNGLFQRKAFSWTATMTDLETVLPSGVQVLSIDPIVAQDGRVIIRLRVTGERERALELVRNLEKSRHFASPRLAQESLATTQGSQANLQSVSTAGAVNFDILADYRPLPLKADDQDEQPKTSAKTPAKTSARTPARASAKKPAKKSIHAVGGKTP